MHHGYDERPWEDGGDWDDEPDAYQLGLLRRKLQSADIPVADISTDTAVYKDNPR